MANTKPLSSALRGIGAMALAAFILTVHDTGTKLMLETYPVNQLVTVRQAFAMLILIIIMAATTGWHAIRVENRIVLFARSVLFTSTTLLIIVSLGLLPVATVLAIVFASPLIVACLSVPFLGERVGPWRWSAIIVGFIGVAIILRPGSPSFEILLLVPVLAAVSSGVRDIVTRIAARTDTPFAILFWSNVMMVTVGLATIPLAWVAMPLQHYAIVFVLAILNTSAHFLMIYALQVGDAALVSPIRYTAIVWAVALGYWVWGDIPDIWMLVGSATVIASGIVLAVREARAARSQPT